MRFVALSIVIACLISAPTTAQIGGNNTYEFLNLVSSARVASLGGNLISVRDDDINLGIYNPALLNETMHDKVALSYINYIADINYGYASYAKHYDSLGTFAATMQYLSYGKFTETDVTGQQLGEFTAGEYSLTMGYGRAIDTLFSIGANLKMVYSALEQYNSFGAAVDLSGAYYNDKKNMGIGLVIKNIGYQLKTYTDNNREPLPFEVQMAVSKKLKHAPLRITVVGENLQKWDLTYVDPNAEPEIDPLTGDEIAPETPGFGDKLMRHIVLNGEILITKNFNVRMGYNYRRRQEMKLAGKPGFVGFSYGVGLRISKFHLSYGRSSYNVAGASNHITVSVRLSDFKGKK